MLATLFLYTVQTQGVEQDLPCLAVVGLVGGGGSNVDQEKRAPHNFYVCKCINIV